MVDYIDFIERAVRDAKGFEYRLVNFPKEEKIIVLNGLCYRIRDFEDEFKKNIYPLLLQRACEYHGIYLKKNGSYYTAHYYDYREFPRSTNPDTAKESALKYIYEQEKQL